MTLPLNFLPNYTLLCTFSSLKVPELFQSPTDFPPPHPKPSHCTLWNQQTLLILNLCLEHFFTSSFKEVCLDTTCSGALWRQRSSVCLITYAHPPHPCFLSPISFSLLQKFLLLRAPANWIYYSILMLVSIICQTLAHSQPRAEYFNSWFTNFPRPYLYHHFQCHHFLHLLNSLPCYPAPIVKFQNLFPVLKMPSLPLFLSPSSKLVNKIDYLCLWLSS